MGALACTYGVKNFQNVMRSSRPGICGLPPFLLVTILITGLNSLRVSEPRQKEKDKFGVENFRRSCVTKYCTKYLEATLWTMPFVAWTLGVNKK
jgi:hypothetical protein